MKNQLTIKNFLIIGLIIALIYLITCNPFSVRPTDKPKVKSEKEQADVVKHDSIASAHFVDSVNKIIGKWKGEAQHWESNWNREVQENAELQDTLGSWLNSPVADTCEKYKQKAIAEFNKLILSSAKKDTACSKAITAYKNIVSQKDVVIQKKTEDWTKLKVNFDTALAQQRILQNAINKLKSKREIYLSVMGIGNPTKIINGYGVGIGYRGKNGTSVELGAMQVANTINYSLSLKKPLIRF